ncbi:hypothetical protein QKW52_29010 [Bacillus sonorensis]|nr:hypothetical protein [Bacillus sonorensis]
MSSSDYVKLANILVGPDGKVIVDLASEITNGLMSYADFIKLKRIIMLSNRQRRYAVDIGSNCCA